MDEDLGGLGPALNRALRAISEAALAPWKVLRPGMRVLPMVPSEEASQAATREQTPAPEPRRRTPTPAPAPAPAPAQRRPASIPEGVLDSEEPEPPRKRARRAKPTLEPGEANWRRPLWQAPTESTGARARIPVAPAALALVRRARAWRAREGRAPSRVTPAAYDAVDTQARFGLIECAGGDRPLPGAGQTLLLAHAPPRRGPSALLDLRPGGTLDVLSTRPGASGWAPLRVQFVTRAGYFAPGRPVTSLAVGVVTAEWEHALRAGAGPPEPPARGGRI